MKAGWAVERLGDVALVVNGGTPRSNVADYWDGAVQWLTPKDMGQMTGRNISKTPRTITETGLSKSSARLVPAGSVILSTRAPIGHLALNEEPMAFNQGCRGLVPGDRLQQTYLYYFLLAERGQLNALGTGTTFKELSATNLKSVTIPLPPLEEQQRIVAILDEAFERLDRAKENAEANLASARELSSLAANDILQSNIEACEMVELQSVANLARGHNPPKTDFIYQPEEGYVRFYQIRDRKSEDYKVYVPESNRLHRVSPDEILMSAYRHIGEVFRGADGAFNVALCKLSSKSTDRLSNDYLYSIIPTDFVKGELLRASERSLIPSMSIKHLKAIKIPLPAIDKQRAIVRQLEALSARMADVETRYGAKVQGLDGVRQSLLAKAFAGELT